MIKKVAQDPCATIYKTAVSESVNRSCFVFMVCSEGHIVCITVYDLFHLGIDLLNAI